MLPRLEAEERLKTITDIGVGTGSMERREQRDVLTSLKKAALIEIPRPRKANAASLLAMGIAVRGPPPAPEKAPTDG